MSGGRPNAEGSVVLSGTSIVDMGDGSLASGGVPFGVTIRAESLTLVLGGTVLPTQSLSAGSITI